VSWSGLGSGMNDNVGAIAALPSGDLVAGGDLTTADGAPANYIARWNGSAWSPLGSGMHMSDLPFGFISSLAVLPTGELAAAGGFSTAGGVVSASFARYRLGCYANCDCSTAAPALNVADFSCFLQKFAAGDSYANCDASVTPPVLNVQDFSCFLQRFAAGCP
jgi:hypothetical protein